MTSAVSQGVTAGPPANGGRPVEAHFRLRRSPRRRSTIRRSPAPWGGPTFAFRRSVPRRSLSRRSVFSVKAAFRVASLNSRWRRTVRRAGSSTSSSPSWAARAWASTGGLPNRSRSNCAAFRIASRCQAWSGLIRKMPESASGYRFLANEKCSSPFSGLPRMLRRMMRLARNARAGSCEVPKAK